MNDSFDIFDPEKPLNMFIDDEKLSYNEYRREITLRDTVLDGDQGQIDSPFDFLIPTNQQVEDCECECESELMANMPTNESFTVTEEGEEREDANAEKFLIELGLLQKVDDEEHFDLSSHTNFDTLKDTIMDSNSQNCSSVSGMKIFDNPFDDEFNPAENVQQQLEKHPLPPIIEEKSQSEEFYGVKFETPKDIEVDSKISETIGFVTKLVNEPTITMEVSPTHDMTIEAETPPAESKTAKKKLTEFGYLLQRKGFRLMRKYYKEKFEEFAKSFDYKKRVKSISPNEMSHIMMKFIEAEFSKLLPILTGNEVTQLLESLKQVVFSDRSNKKEPMTKGIEFGIVRNLFGKYTQKNMKKFMSEPANSFLYTHFYLINGRYECYKQEDVDQGNLNDHMKKLILEAFKSLFTSVKPIYEKLYDNNAVTC